MLSVPAAVKLWYCPAGIDMRLGFDGLFSLVKTRLRADPLSGHLFIFRNRAANRLKVLYWGGHGLCLWCQRLESGRYHFPETAGDEPAIELNAGQFQMVLDGIDLARVRRFKRFALPSAGEALPGG
jgi:transposase